MTRLGIAAESESDARLVTRLADRILLDEVDWLDADGLPHVRRWVGLGHDEWLDVHKAYDLARGRRLPVYGHFSGSKGELDAVMHRAALLLFAEEEEPPSVVVLSRDDDGKTERQEGCRQAVRERSWPFEVLVALAHREIEAWLVAAFEPESEEEQSALEDVRRRIGFDPRQQPERLTSGRKGSKKDAKRVLGELCQHGRSPSERWDAVPLDRLVGKRGLGCGVAHFTSDARATLPRVIEPR